MFKVINGFGTTAMLNIGGKLEQAIYQNKASAYAAAATLNKNRLGESYSVRAV